MESNDSLSHSETDYIKRAQDLASNEKQSGGDLCCCEYVNKNQRRSHILACCCNCEELDLAFDRWIRCEHIEARLKRDMLLTFQDRLRIPWRDGAKEISLDTLVPVVVIPLIIGIASINEYTACIMLATSFIFLAYAYYIIRHTLPRSKFFFIWVLWSVIIMIVVFEVTVPLYEVLPEENLVLVILVVTSLFFLWRTKKCAVQNHVLQSTVAEDELPDITEEEEDKQTSLLLERVDQADNEESHPSICQLCHKYVHPHTSHCSVCQACIIRHDHHSYWLDCCIGRANHKYYIWGLIFAELALLLGSNLALTAICHPFLCGRFFGIAFMLPDDCSDVFEVYDFGLSFIISVYALIMALYISFTVLKQGFVISKGLTLSEYRRGQSNNRKSILSNWKNFIF